MTSIELAGLLIVLVTSSIDLLDVLISKFLHRSNFEQKSVIDIKIINVYLLVKTNSKDLIKNLI